MTERRSIADQVSDEPIDILARRPSRAKRSRDWEKQQRESVGVATYRGIPTELNDALNEIAAELEVTVGEVARVFLEYGLKAYGAGDLALDPKPLLPKFTLFPPE